MRLTNNLDLPDPIVRAIQAQSEGYSKGEAAWSITDLINPPQLWYLRKLHEDKLVEDASQRIWMLLGSAIHNILEHSIDLKFGFGEKRLFMPVEAGGKRKLISGKFDHLAVAGNKLTDYKVTSAYSVKGIKPEWVKQLNYYRMLCLHNDIDVDSLQITAILRDWNRHGLRDPDYPRQSVVNLDLPVWDEATAISMMRQDVSFLVAAEEGNVRPCTDEERWCNPGKFAHMKKKRKSAVRLYNTLDEAKEAVRNHDDNHYIEERPTTYRRCEDYCPVAEYCDQWKEDKA